MALKKEWLGKDAAERIAAIRLRCYGNSPDNLPAMIQRTLNDRFDAGDVLILSDESGDIATATSLSLTINIRGRRLPCQGVAWVGTARSHRRRRIDGRGAASHVMHALLDRARQRRQAVSMLAPFRTSFYERFGYGAAESQHTWTLPLEILPAGDTSGFREARYSETDAGNPEAKDSKAGDFDAMLAGRARQFAQTHGDIETSAAGLKTWLKGLAATGFRFIEVQPHGVASQLTIGTEIRNGSTFAVVHRPWWDSDAALARLLAFLGTLQDQYSFAEINLPVDLPINWLLGERQIPHRRIDHAAARCALISRMQVRILDHVALLNGLAVALGAGGACTVAIRECEKTTSVVKINIAGGKMEAALSSAEPDVVMSDVTWAAVVMGELPARAAAAMGLLDIRSPAAIEILGAFGAGRPYCHEYF